MTQKYAQSIQGTFWNVFNHTVDIRYIFLLAQHAALHVAFAIEHRAGPYHVNTSRFLRL